MKVDQSVPGIVREFEQMLMYHIRKIEHLIKLERHYAFQLKYLLLALKGSKSCFDNSTKSVKDIFDCIRSIKIDQLDQRKSGPLLPIQNEILTELDLFAIRYDLG